MNYSHQMQKALGKLVNQLSVNDYLTLIDDMAKNKHFDDLSKRHQNLLNRL